MEKLRKAIEAYDAQAERIGGCGDGYCIVTGKATGQHTNGGCRCWMYPVNKDGTTIRRLLLAARMLRDALPEMRKE
jgi:hypothetical protein